MRFGITSRISLKGVEYVNFNGVWRGYWVNECDADYSVSRCLWCWLAVIWLFVLGCLLWCLGVGLSRLGGGCVLLCTCCVAPRGAVVESGELVIGFVVVVGGMVHIHVSRREGCRGWSFTGWVFLL